MDDFILTRQSNDPNIKIKNNKAEMKNFICFSLVELKNGCLFIDQTRYSDIVCMATEISVIMSTAIKEGYSIVFGGVTSFMFIEACKIVPKENIKKFEVHGIMIEDLYQCTRIIFDNLSTKSPSIYRKMIFDALNECIDLHYISICRIKVIDEKLKVIDLDTYQEYLGSIYIEGVHSPKTKKYKIKNLFCFEKKQEKEYGEFIKFICTKSVYPKYPGIMLNEINFLLNHTPCSKVIYTKSLQLELLYPLENFVLVFTKNGMIIYTATKEQEYMLEHVLLNTIEKGKEIESEYEAILFCRKIGKERSARIMRFSDKGTKGMVCENFQITPFYFDCLSMTAFINCSENFYNSDLAKVKFEKQLPEGSYVVNGPENI